MKEVQFDEFISCQIASFPKHTLSFLIRNKDLASIDVFPKIFIKIEFYFFLIVARPEISISQDICYFS